MRALMLNILMSTNSIQTHHTLDLEIMLSERCQLDKQQIIQNVITAGQLLLPIFPITPATLSYQKNNHIRERVASLTHL